MPCSSSSWGMTIVLSKCVLVYIMCISVSTTYRSNTTRLFCIHRVGRVCSKSQRKAVRRWWKCTLPLQLILKWVRFDISCFIILHICHRTLCNELCTWMSNYMYMSRNTFMFNISFWVCVLDQLWLSASLVLYVHHCNLHSDLISSVLNTIEGRLFNTSCICQLLPAVLQNPFLKVLTNYLEKVEAYYEEVWELSILILHSWR